MKDITLKTTTSPLLDIEIYNGDFKISESSQQETDIILNISQGNLFQFPQCGVGLINYLASNVNPIKLETLIANQLSTDGFIIQKIDVNNSDIKNITINIEATR